MGLEVNCLTSFASVFPPEKMGLVMTSASGVWFRVSNKLAHGTNRTSGNTKLSTISFPGRMARAGTRMEGSKMGSQDRSRRADGLGQGAEGQEREQQPVVVSVCVGCWGKVSHSHREFFIETPLATAGATSSVGPS